MIFCVFVKKNAARNKNATLRLLNVLVTQHAKWTARRIRRALFGQSLVDFSGSSWSCIKIHKSKKDVPEPTQVNRRKAQVSRMVREFSQAVTETDAQPCQGPENCHSLVPGMSQYGESQEFSDAEIAVAELSQPSGLAQEFTNNSRDFSPTCK